MATTLDLTIIGAYLVGLLIVGFWLSKKAGESSDSYFLGGRRLPWWALGASGMSSNLDVAGTMTLVTLFYFFGLQTLFIEMRGGVVLPIAVFLAFMGKWHRRSKVMTTAEWMHLRFGHGKQGHAARMMAAVTYLIITVGMVVFFLGAAGKFLAVFLPFDERGCQILMLSVAVVYTMLSGLYGVVWTDVLQSVLIAAATIYVGVVGATHAPIPDADAWPGAAHNSLLPSFYSEEMQATIGDTVLDYRLFGLLLLFWAGKGLLEGLGGSGGSAYMAQRFYAARNERDCMRIGMLWTILFAFRWPMVLGFALIAVSVGSGLEVSEDPEQLLPVVLSSEYFPSGIRGLVIAAMLAAAMSTFDSTINAGASYVVRDLYQPLRKRASERELVWTGYAASLAIVAVGLAIAWNVDSIVAVWTIIVINLFPAFLVPFALRWFWGSLNGAGFSLGVLFGFLAALGSMFFADQLAFNEAAQLGSIGGVSLVGCLIGAFGFPGTDDSVRRNFYDEIRPMGFWPSAWRQPSKREHRADLVRLALAVIWQLATFFLPLCLMLRMWAASILLGLVWLAIGVVFFRQAFGPDESVELS